MELPHFGQILTTKTAIKGFIEEIEISVVYGAVYLMSHGLLNPEDEWILYATCVRLFHLGKYVYRGKNGICKCKEEFYRKYLFDGRAETESEVGHIMIEQCGCERDEVLVESVKPAFRRLRALEALWCKEISCLREQVMITELMYAARYIWKYSGPIPMPEFVDESSLFPYNYPGYDYVTEQRRISHKCAEWLV